MRSLVEKYRMGMITDDHLMVESLQLVDPENPGPVLGVLPDSILLRMLRFTNDSFAVRMATNHGALPAQEQIAAARRWIEMASLQKTEASA